MTESAKPRGWNTRGNVHLPGKDTRGKVNLRPEDFDKLVERQGVRVKVYRSMYCPNVKSIDGSEHEITCTLCHGAGFLDRYCLETFAFISNQTEERKLLVEGQYDGNTVAATFMRGIELQYFTLVELLDFSEIFFERIKKQEGSTDVLKYPGLRVNLLVDRHGREYYEGSDFCLDANGSICWNPNHGPDRGTIYSIHYETKIRFRAIKANHSNRFAQVTRNGATEMVRMNEAWTLQKEYLVIRKDLSGNVIAPNKIRDSDDSDAIAEEDGY